MKNIGGYIFRGRRVKSTASYFKIANLLVEAISIPVRNKNKVGRNGPCPCGSGKKYKKCCGKNK